MEIALKEEVRKEISRIVDLMIQAESIRESIAELKKTSKLSTDYQLQLLLRLPPSFVKIHFKKKKKSGKKLKNG